MPFLALGERRLEYEWYGPEPDRAPTLVFLHDGLGCLSLWRDFPARLAAATGCGALVYSRFGYGASSPADHPRPVRFMHIEAQSILPRVLKLLAVQTPILIGQSDGGSISLMFAGNISGDAGCVRGVIVEAAHIFVEDLTVESIAAAGEEYRQGTLKPKLEKHHGLNTHNAFWGWHDVWLDPEFRRWNIAEYLPQIHVPILAIQGEQDNFGTLRQVDAIEAGCGGPFERLILSDCGHTPHRDQPEHTLRAMAEFVRKLRGGGPGSF